MAAGLAGRKAWDVSEGLRSWLKDQAVDTSEASWHWIRDKVRRVISQARSKTLTDLQGEPATQNEISVPTEHDTLNEKPTIKPAP